MSQKIIYQLILSVCFWQVAIASIPSLPNTRQTDRLPKGILDGIIQTALKQAQAVISQVESQILAAVQKAQLGAQNAQNEFNSSSSAAVEGAEEQASSSAQKVNATLERLQAQAQAQQVDVGDCLQQQQGLACLPERVQRCVANSSKVAQQVVARLNSTLQAAGGWRQLQQSKLQDCLGAPLTAVTCLASSATQAAGSGQSVVAGLQQQAQVLQNSFSSIIATLQECVSDDVQKLLASFQQAASRVQQCIAGKLHT